MPVDAETAGNRAKWHDSTDGPSSGLAEAVAEIRRLRSMLYDAGIDPDSQSGEGLH